MLMTHEPPTYIYCNTEHTKSSRKVLYWTLHQIDGVLKLFSFLLAAHTKFEVCSHILRIDGATSSRKRCPTKLNETLVSSKEQYKGFKSVVQLIRFTKSKMCIVYNSIIYYIKVHIKASRFNIVNLIHMCSLNMSRLMSNFFFKLKNLNLLFCQMKICTT